MTTITHTSNDRQSHSAAPRLSASRARVGLVVDRGHFGNRVSTIWLERRFVSWLSAKHHTFSVRTIRTQFLIALKRTLHQVQQRRGANP